jgi:hypothetical protein
MKKFAKIISVLLFTCFVNSACSLLFSFPTNVKYFLEMADKIEVIADAEKKDGTIIYRGDMIGNESLKATITDDTTKRRIVKAVGADTGGDGEIACFIPKHILRATKGEQIVDVEICYHCMRYEVTGALGKISGGLNFTFSESTLNQILFEKGVETK